MIPRLFAVERYERRDSSAGEYAPEPMAPLADGGARLVGALHLPADDVVLALVEGPDATTVSAAATAAGWRVDRISPATWLTNDLPGGQP